MVTPCGFFSLPKVLFTSDGNGDDIRHDQSLQKSGQGTRRLMAMGQWGSTKRGSLKHPGSVEGKMKRKHGP